MRVRVPPRAPDPLGHHRRPIRRETPFLRGNLATTRRCRRGTIGDPHPVRFRVALRASARIAARPPRGGEVHRDRPARGTDCRTSAVEGIVGTLKKQVRHAQAIRAKIEARLVEQNGELKGLREQLAEKEGELVHLRELIEHGALVELRASQKAA